MNLQKFLFITLHKWNNKKNRAILLDTQNIKTETKNECFTDKVGHPVILISPYTLEGLTGSTCQDCSRLYIDHTHGIFIFLKPVVISKYSSRCHTSLLISEQSSTKMLLFNKLSFQFFLKLLKLTYDNII